MTKFREISLTVECHYVMSPAIVMCGRINSPSLGRSENRDVLMSRSKSVI